MDTKDKNNPVVAWLRAEKEERRVEQQYQQMQDWRHGTYQSAAGSASTP